MKIAVNLSNKLFYTLILITILLSISYIIYAQPYTNILNPGHGADAIIVNVPGQGEVNLQFAIDNSHYNCL